MQRTATHKAVQAQTVTNPATGDSVSVIITQLFIYTPAIHYHRNGDPGEPESYDEVGDATIMHAERPFEVLPDWVENNINWDAFLDAPLTPIH